MYFEKKIYDILNEADEFKAKSKETGKVVVFKSKDAMDAAVKGGSHEPLDKPGKSKAEPKGKSVFDPQKPADEPSDMDTERPDDEPEDEWDDTSMGQRMRSYGGRGFGEEPDPTEVDTALQGAEEGMYDALNRGLSYGEDRDVDRMIDNDILAALDAGATDEDLEDFADNLDGEGRQMFQDALNNLAYDLDVIKSDFYDAPNPYKGGRTGSTVNLSPSDPNYKSPGEMDKLGSDNPYDKGDEYDAPDPMAQYDPEANPTLGDMAGDDMDKGIDDAIEGIRDDKREDAFDMIIQSFDDEDELERIYQNLEAGKLPKPDLDPFAAIKHRIIMQGIEDGTINFGSKGMELANYIETREDDLYQQMTEGKHFVKPIIEERISFKKTLRKRAGLL